MERERERGRGRGKEWCFKRNVCTSVLQGETTGRVDTETEKVSVGQTAASPFLLSPSSSTPPFAGHYDLKQGLRPISSRENIMRNRSIENCWISVNGERCVGERLSIRLYHRTALIVLDVNVILDDSSKRRNGNEKFNFLSSFPPRETVFENGDLTR